jgi:transmembrane sensor
MSELGFPLKDHLQDPVDELVLHRMALEIDERLQGRKRRPVLPLALVGATAAVVVIIMFASHLHGQKGPLVMADGREIVATNAAHTGSELDLSDGSRIWLAPGARMEPLESTGTSFSAIVTQGRADFDVRPGGPRRWVVECGLATVEVVGTAFACEREPGHLRVAVRHGVVLVRGDLVPERARRLAAGETIDIVDDSSSAPSSAAPVRITENVPADETAPELESKRANNSTKSWRDLARRGRHNEAFAALGSDGLRRESRRLGINDLLALADVARLSGHPAEAVLPLERILDEFSSDSQAPLAAFALGRLELDSLGHARAAARAFRRALDLGIPRGLREDVLGRLVEACSRSGDTNEARRAADTYQAEFPNGRHARAIQGWLQLR